MSEIQVLENKRDELVGRLDDGYAKIETARGEGQDVTNWEAHWCKLLQQYERICDRLLELQPQPA